MTASGSDRAALGSALCAAVVLLAVVLELVAGGAANSPEPAYSGLFPLTWPQPLRVLWWLAIAAAAAGHRVLLVRAGMATGQVLPVVLALPFVVFAAGVASGASWSTWH